MTNDPGTFGFLVKPTGRRDRIGSTPTGICAGVTSMGDSNEADTKYNHALHFARIPLNLHS